METGQQTRDNAATMKAVQAEARREAAARRQEMAAERSKHEAERIVKWENRDTFPVTSAGIARPYEVLGPVFFQTSNRGIFSSTYDELAFLYRKDIERKRMEGAFSPTKNEWLSAAAPIGQNDFDPAFYICVEELKRRAIALDADAIVGFRMDFDLDTNGYQYFYIQAYGTAVRFVD